MAAHGSNRAVALQFTALEWQFMIVAQQFIAVTESSGIAVYANYIAVRGSNSSGMSVYGSNSSGIAVLGNKKSSSMAVYDSNPVVHGSNRAEAWQLMIVTE